MGGVSSRARHTFEERPLVSSTCVQSWPFSRKSTHDAGRCTEKRSRYCRKKGWVRSTFSDVSSGGHQAFDLQVEDAPANAIASQVKLSRLAQDAEQSDCDSPSYSSGPVHDSFNAALVSAMVGLVDTLEASVTSGRTKLSWHALPILVECRESIASFQDDVRQCASFLHALGVQLQNCTGNGHSCAPEVEMVYQLALRVRELCSAAKMELAESLMSVAMYYRSEGRFEAAVTYFQRCAVVMSCQMGDGHPSVAATLNFLAESLAYANRFNEAEDACKRAVAISAYAMGEDHCHTQGHPTISFTS
eukprot:jgi/Mesvir1/23742/Mv18681-RA.1